MLPIHDVEHELANKLTQQQIPINADKLEMRLHQAILKLPQKQRIVFNLRYFDEMKYEDMSKILGTSVGALKASYHHAVQKVEKYLTGH
jgi:RNA polymerase sigma-70 factor (ECF subfamily)